MGLLVERRDYGYGLEKRLKERVSRAPAPKTVYNTLDRLESEGLVERIGEKQYGRTLRGNPRIIYAPTPAGFEAHRRWMGQPPDLDKHPNPYDEIQMRLAVASPEDFMILRRIVQREIKRCVARLRESARPSLAEVTDEALPWSKARALLAGDAEALHLEAYVQWLHTANAVLKHRLAGAGP